MKKRSLFTRPLFFLFLLFSSSCLDAFQDIAPDFQIQVRIAVCIQDEYQSHHDDARRREDCLAGIRVEAENLGQRLPRPADERHQTVDHRRKRICDSRNIMEKQSCTTFPQYRQAPSDSASLHTTAYWRKHHPIARPRAAARKPSSARFQARRTYSRSGLQPRRCQVPISCHGNHK